MITELSNFAARLCGLIGNPQSVIRDPQFSGLALELFALQLKHNPAYRKICAGRKLMPGAIEHWTEIPVVPTAIFKELDLTSIPPDERTAVFHSSGTTEQKPSRHFHNAESLAVYEASLWSWFARQMAPDLRFTIYDLRAEEKSAIRNSDKSRARDESRCPQSAFFLTPPPEQAPHSSLVHMFETIRQQLGGGSVPAQSSRRSRCGGEGGSRTFLGDIAADGSWTLDFDATLAALSPRASRPAPRALLLLGTAFSFVHLLDYLAEKDLSFQLPPGSRVMETGGYKGRSRSLPKAELHALITERFGVSRENIICEYGMSELSSQAYDSAIHPPSSILHPRAFRFPLWARVQIISPETGREVADGETGLVRVFDLANVFSVMAIQTEDLGVRRGNGFELLGRAQLAEPRGCSLMSHSALRIPHSAIP